jgi:hypothetical protein
MFRRLNPPPKAVQSTLTPESTLSYPYDSYGPAPEPGGPNTIPRLWTARKRPPRPTTAPLGIGVVTYNRRETLQACIEAIERHTRTPFYLVIADDGSTDGSAAWARESGIPVVTGRNIGCAWNKNRALVHLLEQTDCETILLLEEDCLPSVDGWEEAWIDATLRHGHINYWHPSWGDSYRRGGEDTPRRPLQSTHVTGQCTSTRRDLLERIGYLDTRFVGFGWEHVEWTQRFQAELGQKWYPCLTGGLTLQDSGTYFDAASTDANEATYKKVRDLSRYRPAARTITERARLRHEQRRARWPLTAEAGARDTVSIICPTRNEKLARKMVDSFDEPERYEWVWVWNGDGHCDLPGTVVEYQEPTFLYEEAINRGAMASTGSILLIVNDDVQLACQGLRGHLMAAYRDIPSLGALCASLEGQEPGIDAAEWTSLPFPESPGWHGCCWAIRRAAFCAMGGLEESITEYGGDEFVTALRMQRLGFEGRQLKGWRYRHDFHVSYGVGVRVINPVVQIAAALGYDVKPQEFSTDESNRVLEAIRQFAPASSVGWQ